MKFVLLAKLCNKRSKELGLQVEPWGNYYRISEGETVEVYIRGPTLPEGRPAKDYVQFEYEDDLITIYAEGEIDLEIRGGRRAPWPSS